MTTQTNSPLNLDLIGDILTAIASEREPLSRERFTADYANENVEAYIEAFLDPDLVVLIEDALPRPTIHAVKPAVRELAEKIRNSGGWKLVIKRYGTDKILAGIAIREGAAHSDDVTKAVLDIIHRKSTILWS